MKRLLAILLCIVLCFGAVATIAGCGDTDDNGDASQGSDNQGSDNQSGDNQGGDNQGGDSKFADIKVGFVHITDPSDMGYTYNHDLGTQEMQKALGLSNDQIINKFNTPEGAECETALRELVEAGCTIIFATSFGFEDYVLTVAADHPEVTFCHATGYQAAGSGLPNVHNYFVSIYEARYLAGIVAGLKTETNKLGYVAAFPFAEVISGFTAFYLGAKSVNPDVTMEVKYTDSWHDPAVEAQVAQALIDNGADVISQHSDSTAPATTAEANGVWQVGYNADMIEAAPQASLISARANWSIYLIMAVTNHVDGKPIPVDWCEGWAEGAVYLSPLNEAIAPEGAQDAIDAGIDKILSSDFHVFQGPLTGVGVDWDGNEVTLDIPAGDHFPESEAQSAPSFNYIIPGITVS